MKGNAMKYYEVLAKCGHVGKNNYIIKSFGVYAESGKEAAIIARSIPRVKHHHKDAIIDVKEIDYNTYNEIRKNNFLDPYFLSSSIQEQRKICDYNDMDIRAEEQQLLFQNKYKNNHKHQLLRRQLLKESLEEMRTAIYHSDYSVA